MFLFFSFSNCFYCEWKTLSSILLFYSALVSSTLVLLLRHWKPKKKTPNFIHLAIHPFYDLFIYPPYSSTPHIPSPPFHPCISGQSLLPILPLLASHSLSFSLSIPPIIICSLTHPSSPTPAEMGIDILHPTLRTINLNPTCPHHSYTHVYTHTHAHTYS